MLHTVYNPHMAAIALKNSNLTKIHQQTSIEEWKCHNKHPKTMSGIVLMHENYVSVPFQTMMNMPNW